MSRQLFLVSLTLAACGGGSTGSTTGGSRGAASATTAASTSSGTSAARASGSSGGATTSGTATASSTSASVSSGAASSSSASTATSGATGASSSSASSSSGGAGYVTTLAGGGDGGFAPGGGGPPCESGAFNATSIAVDGQGNLYVADGVYARVCKIFPDGGVITLAGNGQPGNVDGSGGATGSAQFGIAQGIAVDGAGYVYVADPSTYIQNIRRIAPDGTTTTLASNPPGTSETAGNLLFYEPHGLTLGGDGNLYEVDYQGNVARQLFPDGGSAQVATGFSGAMGIVVDAQRDIYVSSYLDNDVLSISPVDGGAQLLSGWGYPGWQDGPGQSAELAGPEGLALDSAGNLIVADSRNGRIRMIAPDGTTSTVAGNGSGVWADGTLGPDGTASFRSPEGVAIDGVGNIYVADGDYVRVIRFQ